jgi:5-methyltetrahydropteroyltriglutamate--homocysteine methyltransferase
MKIANSGGTPTYTRPCCTSELEIQDEQSLKEDIKNFNDALSSNNHSKAFMNAASPGVINVFMPNKFYKNDDTYLEKLSEIMSEEYKSITENNLHLQLDCPDLALARHMNYKDLSEEDFLIRAEKQIEALNSALIGIPSDLVRMHICWGNYEGPHIFDIGLEKILPIILKANLKYLLIESSNPRHSHEWQVFKNISLPKDKVIVPGVIDSTSNFVEHPQVVADRLIQFSRVIPKDQLMAGTDCGFSTFAGFGKIDEEICYAKLNSLVEGAAIASKII